MRTYVRTFGGFLVLERASGQFIIEGNVEEIFGGSNGMARIARISQSCRFNGQLEGESMAEFTAVLQRDGGGSFHGFQRISGTLGERAGSFVLSVSGEILKGQPRGSWAIVPKSGSGDFVHIRGSGIFSLPDGKPGKYQLEFDLRKPRAAPTAVVEAADETPDVQREEAMAVSVTASDAPIVVPEKPPRKPHVRKAKPVAEIVAETPVKRARSRKTELAPPEPVAAAEKPAKRTRSRKVEPVAPEPVAVTEPLVKRKRPRQTQPVVLAETITEPAPKPKRARKPAPAEPANEPVAAVAEPIQEAVPVKSTRRKKATPPEPIALPVAEPLPARRRRAKAA